MSKSMNTRARYATLAAMALAAGLAGAAYASSDGDRDADRRVDQAAPAAVPDTSSPQLSMDEVLARLRSAGHSDFREIEREHGRYEVKSRNAQGDRVELYVDARSGEIVKEKRDD